MIGLAVRAGMVGIDQATDAYQVARLEFADRRSHLGHFADDLVSRDDRVDGRHDTAPLVADRVEVGMADPAVEDLDLDVTIADVATRDAVGGQRRSGAGGGVSFCLVHYVSSCFCDG
jgi:hypothetical protein